MISIDPALVQSMIQIIDTCSSRGAFKGPELASVGGVRQVLAESLNQPQPEPQTETETEE